MKRYLATACAAAFAAVVAIASGVFDVHPASGDSQPCAPGYRYDAYKCAANTAPTAFPVGTPTPTPSPPVVAPQNMNFASANDPNQNATITNGTPPFVFTSGCNTAFLVCGFLSGYSFFVNPSTSGTATIVVSDSQLPIPRTVSVVVVVASPTPTPGPPSIAPASMLFQGTGDSPQTATITGGTPPFSCASTAVASCPSTITGSTFSISPLSIGGPSNVTLTDSQSPTARTASVAVTVTSTPVPSGPTSPAPTATSVPTQVAASKTPGPAPTMTAMPATFTEMAANSAQLWSAYGLNTKFCGNGDAPNPYATYAANLGPAHYRDPGVSGSDNCSGKTAATTLANLALATGATVDPILQRCTPHGDVDAQFASPFGPYISEFEGENEQDSATSGNAVMTSFTNNTASATITTSGTTVQHYIEPNEMLTIGAGPNQVVATVATCVDSTHFTTTALLAKTPPSGANTTASAAIAAGATSLTVASNANISVGDYLTLDCGDDFGSDGGVGASFQPSDVYSPTLTASAAGSSGVSEPVHVSAVSGTTITLAAATVYAHASGSRVQEGCIQRVDRGYRPYTAEDTLDYTMDLSPYIHANYPGIIYAAASFAQPDKQTFFQTYNAAAYVDANVNHPYETGGCNPGGTSGLGNICGTSHYNCGVSQTILYFECVSNVQGRSGLTYRWTELGYETFPDGQAPPSSLNGGGFPEHVSIDYNMRELLYDFRHLPRGSVIYKFDERGGDSGCSATAGNSFYGLMMSCDPNTAGATIAPTAQAQYFAMQDLLHLVTDNTAGSPPVPNRFNFTPVTTTYSFSPVPLGTMNIVPLQKKDGTWLLLYWLEDKDYLTQQTGSACYSTGTCDTAAGTAAKAETVSFTFNPASTVTTALNYIPDVNPNDAYPPNDSSGGRVCPLTEFILGRAASISSTNYYGCFLPATTITASSGNTFALTFRPQVQALRIQLPPPTY